MLLFYLNVNDFSIFQKCILVKSEAFDRDIVDNLRSMRIYDFMSKGTYYSCRGLLHIGLNNFY